MNLLIRTKIFLITSITFFQLLSSEPRKIFIDCGFCTCRVLQRFLKQYPEHEFYGFEVQQEIFILAGMMRAKKRFPERIRELFFKAVWIEDTEIEMYLCTDIKKLRNGTTALKGKQKDRPIDYANPIKVPAIDFSKWIADNFSPEDHIIIKMDIEGAEYPVIEKMYHDGTLKYIDKMYVEFHIEQFDTIDEEYHNKIVNMILESNINLNIWN